jgi:hypothetical protein
MQSATLAHRPRLMVGVPTGYLSPQIPPPNVGYNVSVGLELAPGIGVSLDGKALLVGPEGHQGQTDVIGHLEDGSYKNRDSVVLRSGDETTVDGMYGWQDYSLKGSSSAFTAQGEDDLKSFSVAPTADGFKVQSAYSARTWTVAYADGKATVQSDYQDGERFEVSTKGAVTTVDSNYADQDFTVTRHDDGSSSIDGHLKPEDFVFRPTESGYDLKGFYPQQHFRIEQK